MAKKTVKRKKTPAKKSKAKLVKKKSAKGKATPKKKAAKKVVKKKAAPKKKSAPKQAAKKKSAPKKKAAAKKKVASRKKAAPKKKKVAEKKQAKPATKKAASPAPKPSKKRGRAKKAGKHTEDDLIELEDVDLEDVDDDDDDDDTPAPTPAKRGRKAKKKEKQKKIIKAPIIIPNQRIDEKEIVESKKKEPPGKFELEFVVRSSPVILFELLSTPSGLSEWFADDVNIRDDMFTFFWDGSEQTARVIGLRDAKYIRFQWNDRADDGSFFEFKIQIDDLTNDVSLIITDFADNDAERQSSSLLWESQVNKMLHVLGSYF